MKPSVLSTRKLSTSQRELLLNAGIGVVEKDFISIVPLDLEIERFPENLIFTSQNTVSFFQKKFGEHALSDKRVFCVGEKTAQLLSDLGYRVVETTDYGAALAEIIVSKYPEEEFLFLCGRNRNPDLPQTLQDHGVRFREAHLYDTVFTPSESQRRYEGVLFFSPSGVQSFCSENSLEGSIAFCIGTTTAREAEKFTDKLVLATRPTIENVIVQVVRHFA